MKRRDFMARASAALAATTGLQVVPVGAQSLSGAQSIKVGALKVTALSDGFLPIGAEALFGVSPETFADQLAAAFLPGPAHPTGVNAYLIDTGARRILVDTGTGTAFGPTLGHLAESLAAHDLAPDSIDTIFATHLHPDHIGGVLTESGNPFANAALRVHGADIDFWSSDDIKAQAPESAQGFFDMARGALAGFGERVETVTDGAAIAPGVSVVHLPGHTMGHSGLMLDSDGAQLLIFGDIVHVPPVQFAMPEVTIGFDTDQDMARDTRATVLAQAAADRLMIAGAHIGFPGLGYVETHGDGYHFTPAGWQYS